MSIITQMPVVYNHVFKDARGRYVARGKKCGRTKYLGAFETRKEAERKLKQSKEHNEKKMWVCYY